MISKNSYAETTQDERIPSVFANLINNYKEPTITVTSRVVTANNNGCVACPYAGKDISVSACNTCKFAGGISYTNGAPNIKCSYVTTGMKKEASSIQGYHWDNTNLPTQKDFVATQEQKHSKVIEELKFAAKSIGIALAQEHVDEFVKTSEKLSGKTLEKAARSYVNKLQEKISLPERRKYAGKIDNPFALADKNAKTIFSTTPSPDTIVSQNCQYLGSKVNPNTIWDSNALTKTAQVPSNDERIRKAKQERVDEKAAVKESYWKALHEQLSQKGLVSNAKVHSTTTTEKQAFNPKLPNNAMGIFGDNKEFSNIPAKTAGESIAEQNAEIENKKAEEKNSEVLLKAAETAKSKNWLFK